MVGERPLRVPRGRRGILASMPISPDATDAELRAFYEDCYTPGAAHGRRSADAEHAGRWRALCARGKADHVTRLCARAGLEPERVLEVGCGDGAILGWLAADGFAPTLDGCELSEAAVAIAAQRPGVGEVRAIEAGALPYADGGYDLGVLSHVLEHVHDPVSLLRETARVCATVIVEVPLEDNVSARRPAKRAHALEIGHLQRFSRSQLRDVVAGAGLRVAAEISDPLPREVHRFWAEDASQLRRADARWLARRALMSVPPVGRRLITVHWAAACVPA